MKMPQNGKVKNTKTKDDKIIDKNVQLHTDSQLWFENPNNAE